MVLGLVRRVIDTTFASAFNRMIDKDPFSIVGTPTSVVSSTRSSMSQEMPTLLL